MTKLLQQCFLFFIVVVIPGHNLVNSQVSGNRTIGPTLVLNRLQLVLKIAFDSGKKYFHNIQICFQCKLHINPVHSFARDKLCTLSFYECRKPYRTE